jgi:DNA-binding SARP family transcriptional activator
MHGARLRLLDRFTLEMRGEPVRLPTGIQRLLAYLALCGPTPRCVAAGTLWCEVPESQALASLRTSIWRMNRLIPGIVAADGTALALSSSTTVDSREQEDFAIGLLGDDDRGPRDTHGKIECLSHGELLPGWYDDWVVFERERLNQLRLHAMERWATLLTSRKELVTALQLALEAVRAEPLRETANAVLMSVYLAEGNVSDAVHQYETFKDLLQRELGFEPSPSIGALLPERVRH